MKMPRYWIMVAPRDHVIKSVNNGFAQTLHGKPLPLKRLSVNDTIIFYSPKLYHNKLEPCQRFTAIGHITGKDIYQVNMENGFISYRRDASFSFCEEVSIFPILTKLSFIKNKTYWGIPFRSGFLEIPKDDYLLISKRMFHYRNRIYCG